MLFHFLDSTRHYVQMFESIGRLPQMYKYYEHIYKSQLMKSWNECIEDDSSLPQSLSQFYDTVISIFHSQVYILFYSLICCCLCLSSVYRRCLIGVRSHTNTLFQVSWCTSVFPNPVEVVLQMVCSVLSNCESSFSTALSTHLETHDDDMLASIATLKQVSAANTCRSPYLLF